MTATETGRGDSELFCRRCNHNLRGLPGQTPICPECGHANPRSQALRSAYHPWFKRFAFLVAGVGLLMIVAGGMVTSMDAGDSVPDWPLSYGSLLPSMVGNVFYEHGHRLVGMTLGTLVITLAIWMRLADTRRWLHRLGYLSVFMVCFLGALGGLRVKLISSPAVQDVVMKIFGVIGVHAVHTAQLCIVVVHTLLAQSFLCLLAIMAMLTTRGWLEAAPPRRSPTAGKLRRLCIITLAMILLQLVFGAVRRHTGGTIIPHLIGAALVTIHIVLLFRRIMIRYADVRALVRPALALIGLLALQLTLGLGAWLITAHAAATTLKRAELFGSTVLGGAMLTAHVAVGAAILVCCAILTVQAYRRTEIALPVPSSAETARNRLATA